MLNRLNLLFFLHRDTFVLCLLNGGTSFVAGFAIFSVLGFMSYEQGLPISEVAATGESDAALAALASFSFGWSWELILKSHALLQKSLFVFNS